MKRRAGKVILFLLLGAIINFAVAWTSAWAILPKELTSYQYQDWVVGFYESFSAGRVVALPNPGYGSASKARTFPRWSNWPDNLDNTRTRWQIVDVRGWPMFALRSENVQYLGVSGIALAPYTPGSKNGFQQRALPVDPIWPGFAINTIFYTAILWLLFAVPGVAKGVRRWRRIKHRLCPACAYPVGDSAVCTECGQAHSLSLTSSH